MKQKICFEVLGIGVDEEGGPCPASLCMTIDVKEPIPFDELKNTISIKGVLSMAYLDGIVPEENCRMITVEEYEEKYGSDGEEEDDDS